MTLPRQSLIGLGLAAALITAWIVAHLFSVFFLDLRGAGLIAAPVLIALLCWLNVGLFIIAHDAMHRSLAPTMPRLNHAFGRIALLLYAGFDIDRLKASHLGHHGAPGTIDDPDFHAAAPDRLWPWYAAFMRRYFGWREFLRLCVPVAIYLLLGARIANLLLMWALPAALSSLQLFYFGTYRPHRHQAAQAFADDHRARSSDYSWPASLFSCFHFGYHYEHHRDPGVPWWRLPAQRKALAR